MAADTLTCDVCDNESGGTFVGVASIPGAPMSIAWCSECLARDAAPTFVFDHDFIFIAQGDVTRLHEWARGRVTWVDGHYVGFDDYVKRISPADVERELKRLEEAMHELPPSEPGEFFSDPERP